MGVFAMPSLGADMEAGTLVEWLKKPGDPVRRGDIVAVVETEKGAIEIEIFEDGRIERQLVAPGTKVPVGTALALVVREGEPLETAPSIAAPLPAVEPVAAVPLPPAPSAPIVPPSRRRASPAARRLALEAGLDLADITGTGPFENIRRFDVEERLREAKKQVGPDLGPMRRAIAAAMARSKREIPHYYLAHSFDLSAAQSWLTGYNEARPPAERLLLGPLLVKALALALRDFPEFNGFYGSEGFQPSKAVHVGTAIAIRGGGLAAPAIHDTDQLSLAELMTRMRDLVARVRRGGFRSSELSDPTVTASSLGERGVEALYPIIYPPQVAILGFGTVTMRPWAAGDRIEVRPVLTATLAADHRASDGHRGALLLQRIEALLGRPEAL